MNLIPSPDLESSFAQLPAAVKREWRLWCEAVNDLASAPHGQMRGLVELWAGKLGVSRKRIEGKWAEWRQGTKRYSAGDWRILVNHAKAGAAWWSGDSDTGLPPLFIEHWKKLCEENQRKCQPAYRALLRQWRKWRLGDVRCQIPGYAEAPEPWSKDIPRGWSYRNLMNHAPTRWELKCARIGRSAASEERLQVFTSRNGLKVGEYIQFDDVECDLRVNFAGQSKAMRPRALMALDVFSACDFCQGFKPTLWDGERKQTLKLIDMMWLVTAVLTTHGYRTDERGTTLVVEWGTAAIQKAFEDRITAVTNGHVKVERSGKFGKASFAGLFEGQCKGNFRFKASRESLFNLLHNELADLPGQVGKDRQHSPEQNYGMERYNERLLLAQTFLPPEQAVQLLFPVLEWRQFLDCALTALSRMNTRSEHELEGWEAAKLCVSEWRLNAEQPWLAAESFLALPGPEQALALALTRENANLTRVRRLSPAEVWQRGRSELTRLPAWRYPELVGLEHGRPLKVKRGLLEFEEQEMGGKLRFKAEARLGERTTLLRDDRELYLCFVNPFDPARLVACYPDGAVIGECPMWDAPCRNDDVAVREKLGQAVQWEAAALAQLGLRHTDRAVIKAAMHAHNATVLGLASPPAERKKVKENDGADLAPEEVYSEL